MAICKQRSFGPRISLTETQIAKITAKIEAAGLLCEIENCWTGSAYVSIFEAENDVNVNGEPIVVTGEEIAKIRLSGHDEGRRRDSTHSVVGNKSFCLRSLEAWIDEVVAGRSFA